MYVRLRIINLIKHYSDKERNDPDPDPGSLNVTDPSESCFGTVADKKNG